MPKKTVVAEGDLKHVELGPGWDNETHVGFTIVEKDERISLNIGQGAVIVTLPNKVSAKKGNRFQHESDVRSFCKRLREQTGVELNACLAGLFYTIELPDGKVICFQSKRKAAGFYSRKKGRDKDKPVSRLKAA
ncbi:MAG: hypothetical protein GY804_13855 [Alphaproteobacteria bacterium]|nr:hypothetical protein [Alphaproteobacteria bacterium]